jgi:BirA family biotin operon repressor/biotin-[acetyl-CoA-carboxylase] ligase
MDEKVLKFFRSPPGPSAGLTQDELMRRLNTKIIGRKILSYASVDSTNTVAFALAEKGAHEGTAVFSEEQKRGKGRLGRSWSSPRHTGIYLSLILRPEIPPEKAALITLLAAVSCAEAIRKVTGLRAQIKWPNDILVNNKKVCGILTEMQLAGDKVRFIVLGIGINVNSKVSELPHGAGCLRQEAKKTQISRLELAGELMRQLDQAYLYFRDKGSSRLITQWKNFSALSGKRIKVFLSVGAIEGQAQDIDQQGALIVRLDNGFKEHILAGDVVRVR